MGKICSKRKKMYRRPESTVESPEEFYRYLRLRLEDDEIYSLKYLFYSIRVAEQQVGRAFYKFVTKNFKKKFKYELDKQSGRDNNKHNLRTCLMDHCFAFLWVHLDILKNINSSDYIQDLLFEVAACHIYFETFDDLLKVHDLLLYKFIKIEFEKYTNKFTLYALKKYLDITSYRLIRLKKQMIRHRYSQYSTIVQAEQKQRKSIEYKSKELNNLRQIYSGIAVNCPSESSFNDEYYTNKNKPGQSGVVKANTVAGTDIEETDEISSKSRDIRRTFSKIFRKSHSQSKSTSNIPSKFADNDDNHLTASNNSIEISVSTEESILIISNPSETKKDNAK